MKTSVWSSYYYHLSPEDALRELKAHGFNYCELSSEHSEVLLERGDAFAVGKEFGEFAHELGIEVLQGHLFFWGKRICDPSDRALIKKQIELFKGIGIKNAVLHCDKLENPDGTRAPLDVVRRENALAIAELLECVCGTDMVICLENLITSEGANSVEALMYYINLFNNENLGICLDTGHLHINNGDQVRFIRTAGKHIRALHLADNEGKTDQHMMPFGKGNVDFVAVIREMKALDYQGLYNLEIPGESQAPLEILGYKLDYIQNVLAYLDKASDK